MIVVGAVVGVFVLIAVIGILAAIAIPNLLTSIQSSKQKRTLADMRTLGLKLAEYKNEKGQYPPGHAIDEIKPEIGDAPTIDGWGNLYGYEVLEDGGYVIVSGGADRKFEQDLFSEYEEGTTTHYDCDIVFSNGEFVQYPGRD
jgi:type II secretory pathway pseudopilin PulG